MFLFVGYFVCAIDHAARVDDSDAVIVRHPLVEVSGVTFQPLRSKFFECPPVPNPFVVSVTILVCEVSHSHLRMNRDASASLVM